MGNLVVSERKYSPVKAYDLAASGAHPLLAKLWAARGVDCVGGSGWLPLALLTNAREAAEVIAKHVLGGRVAIVADYDADGATGCAVLMRTLQAFGADCAYVVPSRFKHGYGLTAALAEEAHRRVGPTLLVTVDNGISSVEGVERAHELGMAVVVTDHHLPGSVLPAAEVIVNPNQPGCGFPSKALAGCGVAWYVAGGLVEALGRRGIDPIDPMFSMERLLALVALGTVADVVPLDANNRELVARGMAVIRSGRAFPGIAELARVSGKDFRQLVVSDFGFGLGPRLNAAGRMETMDAGIECLLAETQERARELARELDQLNLSRRVAQASVTVDAALDAEEAVAAGRKTLTVFREQWHEGVVGIAAGRLKERYWRPAFVFTRGDGADGTLKGSGRSIPGLHLRDALAEVDRLNPGLLVKFGGHAMAAGATLRADGLERFREAFEDVAGALLNDSDLQQIVEHDGSLSPRFYSLETAEVLGNQVWGQGFPEPLFLDEFVVKEAKPMGSGGEHLRLTLERQGLSLGAVKFFAGGAVPEVGSRKKMLYRLGTNSFRGRTDLQLRVEHFV